MSLLLLLQRPPAVIHTGSVEHSIRFAMTATPVVVSRPKHFGAAERRITFRMQVNVHTKRRGAEEAAISFTMQVTGAQVSTPEPVTVVTATAELAIRLAFRASGSTAAAVTGPAWTGLVLSVLGEGNSTTIGGAELGVTLSEDLNGVVSPGSIETIQHQGAAILDIRSGFDAQGHVHPVVVVPPAAQRGGAQMSVGLAVASGQTSVNMVGTEVLMRLAFEAGGELTSAGAVVEHPQQLGVEFGVTRNETVIVHIPPLADWKVYRAQGTTPEIGDPEFF